MANKDRTYHCSPAICLFLLWNFMVYVSRSTLLHMWGFGREILKRKLNLILSKIILKVHLLVCFSWPPIGARIHEDIIVFITSQKHRNVQQNIEKRAFVKLKNNSLNRKTVGNKSLYTGCVKSSRTQKKWNKFSPWSGLKPIFQQC